MSEPRSTWRSFALAFFVSASACTFDERATEAPEREQSSPASEAEEPQGDLDSTPRLERSNEAGDRFAEPPPPRDEPADPIRELDRLEARLAALGVDVKQTNTVARSAGDDGDAGGGVGRNRNGKKDGVSKKAEKGSKPSAKPKEPPATVPHGNEQAKDLQEEAEAVDSRCAQLCEVAEAICGLETQLCDLALSHPEDDRYAAACERAERDCELASDACQACAG